MISECNNEMLFIEYNYKTNIKIHLMCLQFNYNSGYIIKILFHNLHIYICILN